MSVHVIILVACERGEQVAPSPEISFPHAAMTTPEPSSTPWLQPLTAALKSLDKEQKVTGLAKKQKVGKLPAYEEVAPRFVSPVWEDLAKDGRIDANSDSQDYSHVAVDEGEQGYKVGGGGCWLLRSKSKAARF